MSQTNDPVSGGWFLYALQVDPVHPIFLGDYPKLAIWNSGGSPAQNAYFLTMNVFSSPIHVQRRSRLCAQPLQHVKRRPYARDRV